MGARICCSDLRCSSVAFLCNSSLRWVNARRSFSVSSRFSRCDSCDSCCNEKCKRLRHSPRATSGSANSHGIPPISGNCVLQAVHTKRFWVRSSGVLSQRGQAINLTSGFSPVMKNIPTGYAEHAAHYGGSCPNSPQIKNGQSSFPNWPFLADVFQRTAKEKDLPVGWSRPRLHRTPSSGLASCYCRDRESGTNSRNFLPHHVMPCN